MNTPIWPATIILGCVKLTAEDISGSDVAAYLDPSGRRWIAKLHGGTYINVTRAKS